MGGRLALSRATVTGPDGIKREKAGVQVIGATLRVLEGSSIAVELVGVDRIDRVSATAWRVVMVDGSAWAVLRAKGCGCRGGA
jgi:hypothetical protein